MKKSIIAMLCSLLIVAGCNKKDDQNYKADYPIYSPVKVYGTLTLTEASSLPPGADYMIIPYLDTLRIYQDGAWRNFWPVIQDNTPEGTTVGNSLLTLTNPSAISFLRVNANNSVTALSATNFKTALSFTAADVGLGNVTNESKATMFTSPTFTGIPIVPNPALGTYNQQIASTAFVYDKVVSILDTMDFAAGSFDGDTLEANYVIVADSIYPMGVGVDLSDVWWSGTSNGAMDTGHVENAWYGLVHALDNPMLYLNDTKEVEGCLELKVWYIDDKTGEPACQYGIKGLSPTEAATAFQINHEFMTRYVADHEARLQKLEQATKQDANLGLDVKFLIGLLVFVALMGLIVGFRR